LCVQVTVFRVELSYFWQVYKTFSLAFSSLINSSLFMFRKENMKFVHFEKNMIDLNFPIFQNHLLSNSCLWNESTAGICHNKWI